MRYLKKYLPRVLLLCMLFTMILPLMSLLYADVGPKPSLTIIVKGMATDQYWLDLLVTDEENYSWLKIEEAEKVQVSKLTQYRDEEGYHPALLGGTKVPMTGSLKGEKQKDGSFVHEFGYVGVPRTFRIAILTEAGDLILSDVIHRKQFTSIMQYDLSDREIQESSGESVGRVTEGMSWGSFLLSFLASLALTWVVEIFIAIGMGFTWKKSLKVLLVTNFATQILLNLTVFYFNNTLGHFWILIGIVIGEFMVLIAESIVYNRLLTEGSPTRRRSYTFLANLASVLAGYLIVFM